MLESGLFEEKEKKLAKNVDMLMVKI